MTVITPSKRYLRIFASQYMNFKATSLGCIHVGPFSTPESADRWQQTFVVSAVCHGIRVRVYPKDISIWSLRKQVFDFDPESEDGLPWEVVAALEGILPVRAARRAAWNASTC